MIELIQQYLEELRIQGVPILSKVCIRTFENIRNAPRITIRRKQLQAARLDPSKLYTCVFIEEKAHARPKIRKGQK